MTINHRTTNIEGCKQVYRDLGFSFLDQDLIDGFCKCDELLTSPCKKYPIDVLLTGITGNKSVSVSQIVVEFVVDDSELAEKMKKKGYNIKLEEKECFNKSSRFKVSMPDGLEILIEARHHK